MDDRDQRILDELRADGWLSYADLATRVRRVQTLTSLRRLI